jgi:ATP-dependent RNA helicase DeaD
MTSPEAFSDVLPPLARALVRHGFEALTPVQQAVLNPELAGRDLRISSRTGSGKTVALGLVVAPGLVESAAAPSVGPRVLLVAPTRELAAQIGKELQWLYAELKINVCVVTGGTSVTAEHRALSRKPTVVVGTPGRLCDHLNRGLLDLSHVEAVVLDEADQMLDLGFREPLELLLGSLKDGCRTHLVSATFPRAVLALAARYQNNALSVMGSEFEAAHSDISYVAHVVHPRERYAALVNVLLMAPEERTLIFVRTRADAAGVAGRLANDGFRAAALSGEMAQAERTRTLDAFRAGNITALVCTDVASRGIDVPEVQRVIHGDLPDGPEPLTHRSGRTGRAGNKGVSILIVPANSRGFAEMLLRGARVRADFRPAPAAEDVKCAAEQRLFDDITSGETDTSDQQELAKRLLQELGPDVLAQVLLSKLASHGPCAPNELTTMETRPPRPVQRAAPPAPVSRFARTPQTQSASRFPMRRARQA